MQGQLQVLRDYRREYVNALLTGGVGAWFLLWLLMLRPKILFIGLRLLLLLAGVLVYTPLSWLALAGLALDTELSIRILIDASLPARSMDSETGWPCFVP